MTTTRFPSRDGMFLGLLYLVLGFAAVFVLTLIGFPAVVAGGGAVVGAAVTAAVMLRPKPARRETT